MKNVPVALAKDLFEALELMLRAIGALSNPSELADYGLTPHDRNMILAAYQRGKRLF